MADALKNARQFYTWKMPGEPDVVFSINNEAPFGWYLSEFMLANNERVPWRLRRELKLLLEGYGIRSTISVKNMMAPYRQDDAELIEVLEGELLRGAAA